MFLLNFVPLQKEMSVISTAVIGISWNDAYGISSSNLTCMPGQILLIKVRRRINIAHVLFDRMSQLELCSGGRCD